MFMRKVAVGLAVSVLVAACAAPTKEAGKPERLGIGKLATAEEIRGWDIDVTPDGAGLPPGSGTVADGRKVYAEKCLACHGANGVGGPAPRLTGGIGSLKSANAVRTVGSFWPYATTVYDYVNRAMPWDKPLSLTSSEVYAVTAYLLHANNIIPESAVMDAKTLPQVKMPNRDGFFPASNAPDIHAPRCMTDCSR